MTGAPAAEGNQASRFRSRDDCLGRTAIVVGMDGLTPAFVAKQVSAMAAWPLLLVARSRALVGPASNATREDTASRSPRPLTPRCERPSTVRSAPGPDETQSSALPPSSRLLSGEEQAGPHTTCVREVASRPT
jgi:hypothetical protein